ncbi:hypothetical protein D3C73_1251630 [compost metagenome]
MLVFLLLDEPIEPFFPCLVSFVALIMQIKQEDELDDSRLLSGVIHPGIEHGAKLGFAIQAADGCLLNIGGHALQHFHLNINYQVVHRLEMLIKRNPANSSPAAHIGDTHLKEALLHEKLLGGREQVSPVFVSYLLVPIVIHGQRSALSLVLVCSL